MICISIGDLDRINEVNQILPPVVELRLDLIKHDPEKVLSLLDPSITVIGTFRKENEDQSQQREQLKKCMDYGVQYIDLEVDNSTGYLEELVEYAHSRNVEVIMSWHNYFTTPERDQLNKMLAMCYSKGGDIAKIACMVTNEQQLARLVSLYEVEGRKVIVGMGEMGKISRFSAIYYGAEFTFAAVSENRLTAPGQLTYKQILELKEIFES